MTAETKPSPAPDPEEPPKTSSVPLWLVVFATIALGAVVNVIIYGYLYKPGWVGVSDKKLWDYLELLIVPAALAIGVAGLNWAQRKREREAEEARQERERVVEEARRERELEVQNRQAQDAALQAYLDQMSHLLLEKNLRKNLRNSKECSEEEEDSEGRMLARARTLTVLTRLDGVRKASVVRFLYEADLITEGRVVLDLSEADLSGAFISGLHLRDVNLSKADLSGADLNSTLLREINLRNAILNGADLHALQGRNIDLFNAQLSRANLSEAKLLRPVLNQANLSKANLHRAVLTSWTQLYTANLRGADLSGADLRETEGLTQGQIDAAMGNQETLLPAHLKRPDTWSLPVEEQRKRLPPIAESD